MLWLTGPNISDNKQHMAPPCRYSVEMNESYAIRLKRTNLTPFG